MVKAMGVAEVVEALAAPASAEHREEMAEKVATRPAPAKMVPTAGIMEELRELVGPAETVVMTAVAPVIPVLE